MRSDSTLRAKIARQTIRVLLLESDLLAEELLAGCGVASTSLREERLAVSVFLQPRDEGLEDVDVVLYVPMLSMYSVILIHFCVP